jgi:hypothetical protein
VLIYWEKRVINARRSPMDDGLNNPDSVELEVGPSPARQAFNRRAHPWERYLHSRWLWVPGAIVALGLGVVIYRFAEGLFAPLSSGDRASAAAEMAMEQAQMGRANGGDGGEWIKGKGRRLKFGVAPQVASPDDGTLSIKCDTWGWVSVDGKQVGTCPMSPIHVAAGEHEVKIGDDFKAGTQTVTVVAGETTEVDLLGATKAPPLSPAAKAAKAAATKGLTPSGVPSWATPGTPGRSKGKGKGKGAKRKAR